MTTPVEGYWQQYRAMLPPGTRPRHYHEAFRFGVEPADARVIADLVLAGTKTATGSLVWACEADGRPLARVGDLSIVTDADDQPLCIIEAIEIVVRPLDEVDARFAYDGGEGDRTLPDWRRIYWGYVCRECARLGRAPSWQAPIACERFRVVYREPLAGAP